MTALKQYARLEAPGIWRPDPDAQRREVTVTFGDASLVISDAAGRALTHWSLAAVLRVNGRDIPALYTPSAEGTETLEIEEPLMVEAIDRVRGAILKARPHRGRVRLVLLASLSAALIAGAVAWLPEVLVRHTLSVVPEATRAEIGAGLFRAIGRVSGSPCRSERGDRALAQLHSRLLAPEKGGLLVVPAGIDETVSLPGGLMLLGRALVEDHESPDVLAGYILAERTRRERMDPMRRLLDAAGTVATLRLLTTGQVRQEVLEGYAEALVRQSPEAVDTATLLRRFAEARVSSTPYAYAVDVTGEATLALIEADPMRGGDAQSVLPDGAWVALQGICGA